MRLLILSPEFPPGPGGIGTHAYQLARYLCERGWAVTVVTAQDYAPNSEIADFNARQPFQIIRLARLRGVPIRVLYRAGVFWRQIRRLKPDVILAANERAVWAVAALKGRIPAVAVGHGTEFGLTGLQAWLNRWAYARLDHIVCVSQFTWDMMIRQGIAPRRGSIIPNGADEAHFKVIDGAPVQEFRARHGLDQARLLLTVGHVTERKGQQVVIRALPQILKEVPDVHYLVAGLPALKQKYSALAESLGVADRVHFLGRVAHDELPVLMNACDVFIMTSVNTPSGDVEGYGIAVVEAALCGKPAVVSGDSGLAEAVIDRETGFVVPQNDPEQTARAVIALLKDDELRRRLGTAARQRALAKQTWSVRLQAYETVLRELVR